MITTVGNFWIGQKEVKNPASWLPADRRNETALVLNNCAICSD